MFTAFIAFIMLIVGLVTGYTMHPKISRKISYKKRGIATRQRAAMKRSMKEPAIKKSEATRGKKVVDQYLNGTTLN